jgi:hypothetical protein
MWLLVVLLVRYQLIGRGRTGILEKFLGRMCEKIWNGNIRTAADALTDVRTILPTDEQFSQSLVEHVEAKPSRISYVLAAINEHIRSGKSSSWDGVAVTQLLASDVLTVPLYRTEGLRGDVPILDYALIERSLVDHSLEARDSRSDVLRRSSLPLTRAASEGALELNTSRTLVLGLSDYHRRACSYAVATWCLGE